MTTKMRNRQNSGFRKGNAPIEIIIIIVILVVLGITFSLVSNVLTPFNDAIQANTQMPNVTKEIMDSGAKGYPTAMDNSILFGFIALTIASIAFAFMVDTAPGFLIITVLLLIFGAVGIMFVANSTANIFDDLGNSLNFPKTTWIFHHLLQLYLIIGFLIMGALYAKSQN